MVIMTNSHFAKNFFYTSAHVHQLDLKVVCGTVFQNMSVESGASYLHHNTFLICLTVPKMGESCQFWLFWKQREVNLGSFFRRPLFWSTAGILRWNLGVPAVTHSSYTVTKRQNVQKWFFRQCQDKLKVLLYSLTNGGVAGMFRSFLGAFSTNYVEFGAS